MALVNQLTTLHRRLNELPSRFGVPQYVPVVLEKLDGTFELLSPNPKVSKMPTRAIGGWLSESVQITGDELIVSGISREYPLDIIKLSRYLVNAVEQTVTDLIPVLDTNGIPQFDAEGNAVTQPIQRTRWVGDRCTCLHLDDKGMTTYTVTLVPRLTK